MNGTNETFLEFERVSFARNPTNTFDDECYIDGECRSPISLIEKLGNPKLEETFPEMLDFLDNFDMTSTDVNEIIAYQSEIEAAMGNQSLTHSQIVQTWYVMSYFVHFCALIC